MTPQAWDRLSEAAAIHANMNRDVAATHLALAFDLGCVAVAALFFWYCLTQANKGDKR